MIHLIDKTNWNKESSGRTRDKVNEDLVDMQEIKSVIFVNEMI